MSPSVPPGIKQQAINVYRGLPTGLQRHVVRAVLPTYTLGTKVHITEPSGLSLLVKPSYHPQWDLPSGYAKAGEDPVTCALREVREETGLLLELDEPAAVVIEPDSRRVDVLFRVELDVQPSVSAKDVEIEAIGWFNLEARDLNDVALEAINILEQGITLHISDLS
jgi:8-oxo-dGTP pyrophosphatase MutT (NUDIX family)